MQTSPSGGGIQATVKTIENMFPHAGALMLPYVKPSLKPTTMYNGVCRADLYSCTSL